MDLREDHNPFDSLPEEALVNIFEQLDLVNVKNASLVCQRWNRIIFSNHNIKRFRIILGEKILRGTVGNVWSNNQPNADSLSPQALEQQRQREVLQLISQSQRCYRSIKWHITCNMEEDNVVFFKSLCLWKTEYLQSLAVNFHRFRIDMLTLLGSTMRLMPQLHSLEILNNWKEYVNAPKSSWITLHSKSVRNLRLHYPIPATFDMPSLQNLDTTSEVLHEYDNNIQQEKLVQLKIRSPNYQSFHSLVEHKVYRQLTNLETLRCFNDIHEDQFAAICKTSTLLKELTITSSFSISDSCVLHHLYNLTHLRKLRFGVIKGPDAVFLVLSKLTNLQHLGVIHGFVDPASIFHLPDSIVKLELSLTPENGGILMGAVVHSMAQLTELTMLRDLADCSPIIAFALLPHLARLEVLKIVGGLVEKTALLIMPTPMYRLRKLLFEKCQLDSTRLKGLREKFPNLKQLNFVDCASNSRGRFNYYKRF